MVEPAGGGQGAAHGGEGAAELHDDGAVGVGEPAGELGLGQCAGQHGQHVRLPYQRGAGGHGGRGVGRDAGHDLGGVALGEPVVHVHVGAVEQRIALREQDHGPARVEMPREPRGGRLVEVGQGALVAERMVGGADGHGVDQLLLDGRGGDQVTGDAAGVGPFAGAGVVGHDVGRGDEACGLERDQFGVAGADADPVEAARRRVVHSASRASAFRAEDVMAEPPLRPRTVT